MSSAKIDFRRQARELYAPPAGRFVEVEVPAMNFVKVDGHGDPNVVPAYRAAVEWLYAVSYAMKFAARAQLGTDYVVPPLEGLWWATDPAAFAARRKDEWSWTMMIMAPDLVTPEIFEASVARASKKLGTPPDSLRHEPFEEGLCLQTLHVGSYDDEAPLLARLHDELMPAGGWAFAGPHHEIYLSDPRKVAPEKLKTVLRQPVRKA
jgi:hypothetical protein